MEENTTLLPAACLAFVVCSLTLAALLRSGIGRRLAIDLPNHRSLHSAPTPRIGGIGVLAGMLAVILGMLDKQTVLAGALASLALVSFADDRKGLPAAVRLACHLAVAAAWLWLAGEASFGWPAIGLVAVIAWTINLYNFMDGADGLAGGMAAIGFAVCARAAWIAGDAGLAMTAAGASAAAAGFLLFNFPPARTFLGDVGSVPLGFLVAALGIMGWHRGHWPAGFVLMVFSPFIVDATVTLAKRMVAGEKFWRAHRDHYYQRLVRMGWNHRRLAWAEYALMIASGMAALASLQFTQRTQIGILLLWMLALGVLMVAVDVRWRHFQGQSPA
jgi:UDP-N-acetylmuramyl pentapeptide phosphotransferase/UDP-N-acetylglucosamine-1-phosphate transferase